MALENWMAASRYLPSAKYLVPLSKYFCLRTLGSREQPANAARRQHASSRRTVAGRLIMGFSNRRCSGNRRAACGQRFMILQGYWGKQLRKFTNKAGA